VPARVGLASILLDRDEPAEAVETLQPVATDPAAVRPLARARLMREAAEGAEFGKAAARALEGQHEEALSELLSVVREGPGQRRDRARELMLDVFRVLGDDDPLARRYRRDLTSALF
jgi:hypothetical protein